MCSGSFPLEPDGVVVTVTVTTRGDPEHSHAGTARAGRRSMTSVEDQSVLGYRPRADAINVDARHTASCRCLVPVPRAPWPAERSPGRFHGAGSRPLRLAHQLVARMPRSARYSRARPICRSSEKSCHACLRPSSPMRSRNRR